MNTITKLDVKNLNGTKDFWIKHSKIVRKDPKKNNLKIIII